jgi:hypothetical protein
MKNRVTNSLLLVIVCIIVFSLIWSKLRIVIFVPMSPLTLLGVIVGVVLVIFFALDHLINRSK